jgi:uncharacterized protein YbjT (DUF2867 family)
VIAVAPRAMPPVGRLMSALSARRPDLTALGTSTSVLCLDASGNAPNTPPEGARLLVFGWIGTHRDARDARLRAAWDLEERARASGLPTLVLRLAPVLAQDEPMWHRLGSRPRLGRRVDRPLQPVLKDDVLATLERALEGRAAWDGWFEVCGDEILTLGELVSLASGSNPPAPGAWEPPLEIVDEQPLAEPGPWRERFEIRPARVSDWARRAA